MAPGAAGFTLTAMVSSGERPAPTAPILDHRYADYLKNLLAAGSACRYNIHTFRRSLDFDLLSGQELDRATGLSPVMVRICMGEPVLANPNHSPEV